MARPGYEDDHPQKQQQHDQEDSERQQQVRAAIVPHAQFQLACHRTLLGRPSIYYPRSRARLYILLLRRIELQPFGGFQPQDAATRERLISAILKKASCIQVT